MGRRPKDPTGYSLGEEASGKVAARLRPLIKASAKSQAAIAREAKLEPPHLSELLKADGTRNFQRWQILGIARALGTTERDIVGGIVPDAALAVPPSVNSQRPLARPIVSDPADRLSLEQFIEARHANLEHQAQRLQGLREILEPRLKDERLTSEQWLETFDKLERLFAAHADGGGAGREDRGQDPKR
jgi:hypothetical protein